MKTQKTLITFAAIALAIAGIGAASQHERRSRNVVILFATQEGFNDSTGFVYNGAAVYCSSSSSNAPTFPQQRVDGSVPLTALAPAVAALLEDGYIIKNVSPDNLSFTLVK